MYVGMKRRGRKCCVSFLSWKQISSCSFSWPGSVSMQCLMGAGCVLSAFTDKYKQTYQQTVTQQSLQKRLEKTQPENPKPLFNLKHLHIETAGWWLIRNKPKKDQTLIAMTAFSLRYKTKMAKIHKKCMKKAFHRSEKVICLIHQPQWEHRLQIQNTRIFPRSLCRMCVSTLTRLANRACRAKMFSRWACCRQQNVVLVFATTLWLARNHNKEEGRPN